MVDDGRMQLPTACRGKAVENGVAGRARVGTRGTGSDLEQVRPLALLEIRCAGTAHRPEQVELDPVRHHGRGLQQLGALGQAGSASHDGVAHRCGHTGRRRMRGPRSRRTGCRLSPRGRVTAGRRVLGETGHSGDAQGRQGHAHRPRRAGEMAERLGETRRGIRRVLPKGDDEGGRGSARRLPRKTSRSRVASSAQWMSSMTATVGRSVRRSSRAVNRS